MCGISGIINQNNTPVPEADVLRMNELIAHRGPDGEGSFFKNNFAFGHRRLSILDLSKGSHQPMKRTDDLVITFNGEIYNYLEIKFELQNLGHQFETTGDTEVVLAAYQEWGEACVSRFNGMWAFSIYDAKMDILFCSRDRFGIKPFYYSEYQGRFFFGSEIKQLLPFFNKVELNENILLEYLITGLEEFGTETFFKNVIKLPGGHNLTFNLKAHDFVIKPYYQITLQEALKTLNEELTVDAYSKQLNQATKLRLRSDVRVGTCLSGGLDSSSVAAIAAKLLAQESENKFTAIHAKSSEKNTDESAFAQEVSDKCNLDLHIIEPSTGDFQNIVDEVIYTQEEPFGSPSIFMQYFVMKKAREIGCIVMLDGQGGDETLLGYEKYYPAYILSQKGISSRLKAFNSASFNSKLSRLDVIKYYFYFTKYKVRLKSLKKKLGFIKAVYLEKFESDILKEISANYLDVVKLQKTEVLKTQLPRLLRYEDKNSMRNSIESRLPLIDYNVLETALSINNNFKIHNGWTKYVLRKVVSDLLPKSIAWRKNKLGFNAPEQTWLDSISQQMSESIAGSKLLKKYLNLEKIDLDKLDYRRKWRLFNIAKWEQIYNVEVSEDSTD